jgi:hypothetical protein
VELPERPRGLGGARLRMLRSDGLAAVYSRHHSLRPQPSRREVLAHERVLEAVMKRGPVLPLRFGTQLRSEQELEETLRERREELLQALERVRGRVELGLRVLGDRRQSRRGDRESGRDFLLGRLAERRSAERAARHVHAPLADLAVASRVSEWPSPPAILVGSYLVDEGVVERFRSRANELAVRQPDLRVIVTGPWPPYGFTSEEEPP